MSDFAIIGMGGKRREKSFTIAAGCDIIVTSKPKERKYDGK